MIVIAATSHHSFLSFIVRLMRNVVVLYNIFYPRHANLSQSYTMHCLVLVGVLQLSSVVLLVERFAREIRLIINSTQTNGYLLCWDRWLLGCYSGVFSGYNYPMRCNNRSQLVFSFFSITSIIVYF